MKKLITSIIVLITVISTLCSATLSVWAISSSSGLGILDNTLYYIVNVNGEYLHPKAVNSYDTSSTTLKTTSDNIDYTAHPYMWKVEKQSDGTYIIKSHAAWGKYLSVGSDNIVNTVGEANNITSSMKFDICRVETGTNQGMYTIKNGNKYLKCFSSSINESDTTAHMNNKPSYWTFMAVNKYNADYYGYADTNLSTSSLNTLIRGLYNSWGYNGYSSTNETSADNMLFYMTENDITIYAGAGDEGVLILDPNSEASGTMIMADCELANIGSQEYISDLDNNALAQSRCVIYMSSLSGLDTYDDYGNEYNLVDATYEKGAHYVLGFMCEMDSSLIVDWLDVFVECVNANSTIQEAVETACISTRLYGIDPETNEYVFDDIYYRGDGRQLLNF